MVMAIPILIQKFMTFNEETTIKLEYANKHEPIRYTIKRIVIIWVVVNLEGATIDFFWRKKAAVTFAELLNAVYNLGYSMGMRTLIQIIAK
jgi:hypothetical protein